VFFVVDEFRSPLFGGPVTLPRRWNSDGIPIGDRHFGANIRHLI
jgi:hypothetical protein